MTSSINDKRVMIYSLFVQLNTKNAIIRLKKRCWSTIKITVTFLQLWRNKSCDVIVTVSIWQERRLVLESIASSTQSDFMELIMIGQLFDKCNSFISSLNRTSGSPVVWFMHQIQLTYKKKIIIYLHDAIIALSEYNISKF